MSSRLSPGEIIGKYEVISWIGAGAMATVYKVRHTKLDALYALKILDNAGRMHDRFLREGRVQASLRHPNIVSVHDVLEVNGRPALVMEYVEGPTLSAYILANEPLSLEQIDTLALGLIRGVRAAHRAGHLHRDLKPANILLQPLEGVLVPKIADFGLVKVLGETDDGSQTKTGQLLGSPAYMSPEQTQSATELDQRTDVWAVGVVLYQLVTGRLAFPQRDLVLIFSMIRSGEFRDPRSLRERIPKRMWAAILGAMTVDPEQRIHSIDELLEVWQGKKPPAVVPDLPSAENSRRRWYLVALATLLFGIGALLFTVSRPQPAPPPVHLRPIPSKTAPAPQKVPTPAPPPAVIAPVSVPVAPVATPPVHAAPIPTPAPITPEPPPQPEAPHEPASFRVSGDAEAVWLVGGGKHFKPGPLPPGVYSISARFPGRPLQPIEGVEVTLTQGDAVQIECSAGFRTCRQLK